MNVFSAGSIISAYSNGLLQRHRPAVGHAVPIAVFAAWYKLVAA